MRKSMPRPPGTECHEGFLAHCNGRLQPFTAGVTLSNGGTGGEIACGGSSSKDISGKDQGYAFNLMKHVIVQMWRKYGRMRVMDVKEVKLDARERDETDRNKINEPNDG